MMWGGAGRTMRRATTRRPGRRPRRSGFAWVGGGWRARMLEHSTSWRRLRHAAAAAAALRRAVRACAARRLLVPCAHARCACPSVRARASMPARTTRVPQPQRCAAPMRATTPTRALLRAVPTAAKEYLQQVQAHMEEEEEEGVRRGVTGGSDEDEEAGPSGKDALGDRLRQEVAEVRGAGGCGGAGGALLLCGQCGCASSPCALDPLRTRTPAAFTHPSCTLTPPRHRAGAGPCAAPHRRQPAPAGPARQGRVRVGVRARPSAVGHGGGAER